MVDVALIELEGVVFDTAGLRYESLRDAVAAQALDFEIDRDVVAGLAPRAAVVAALANAHVASDPVVVDLVTARAERAFSAKLGTAGLSTRPGARAFLQTAVSHARLGTVTRATRADATTMLRLAGLEAVFSLVICADDTIDAKPSPQGYELAIERLKRQRSLARGLIIALEDGAAGIRAARTANIRCAAVGPLPAHVAIEADAYVPSLEGQTITSLDQLSRPGQERVQ